MDTSVFVTEVPILVPMITGTALATSKTPDDTRTTTRLVVAEELWMRLVAKIPTKRPTKGLLVRAKSFCEKPAPKHLNAVSIPLILTRKK